MIQILLHNLKMDPLVSLHYYAPVCAAINLLVLPFTEGLAPFYELQNLGVGVLVTNASVAFLLNVAAVFLVGVGSGLVLTLAGVFKVSNWFLWSFILQLSWRFSVSWCALHIRSFLSYLATSFHFIYNGLVSLLSRASQPRHYAHICTLQLALFCFFVRHLERNQTGLFAVVRSLSTFFYIIGSPSAFTLRCRLRSSRGSLSCSGQFLFCVSVFPLLNHRSPVSCWTQAMPSTYRID
jgi:hypothetical protein